MGYTVQFINSIDDYTLRANFEWLLNDKATIKFGYQTSNLNFYIVQNYSGNLDTTYFGTSASSSKNKNKELEPFTFYSIQIISQLIYSHCRVGLELITGILLTN